MRPQRRKKVIGGYDWKYKLTTLRNLDYEDKEMIEELIEIAKTKETVALLAKMLTNKLDRLRIISEMLEDNYVEPEEPEL